MTRYVVQITRTYEVQAEDDDAAQVEALAEDESEDRQPPTFNVTDLDEAERAGRPIAVEPGMCPYPINGKLTARECVEAGQCGCKEGIAIIERLGFGDQPEGDA